MNSYRSAYEEYYKNINNIDKENNNKKMNSIFEKRTGAINSKYNMSYKNSNKIIERLTKRIIKELTGATILIIFFICLKYAPSNEAKEMHSKCKQTLSYNINYNECINAINTIKIEDLKTQAYNFMEYIKNNSNMQN